jgi:hypothetical protein
MHCYLKLHLNFTKGINFHVTNPQRQILNPVSISCFRECVTQDSQKIAYSKNSYLFMEPEISWELFIIARHWTLLRGIHSEFSDCVYLSLSVLSVVLLKSEIKMPLSGSRKHVKN